MPTVLPMVVSSPHLKCVLSLLTKILKKQNSGELLSSFSPSLTVDHW